MISGGIQSFLALFAVCAFFFNDVLALISILGSVVLAFGSFPHSPFQRLTGLAEWNSAPLVFGTFFQGCFLLSGMRPETESMGVLVPMPPDVVSAMFALSLALMAGRCWLKRLIRGSSDHGDHM